MKSRLRADIMTAAATRTAMTSANRTSERPRLLPEETTADTAEWLFARPYFVGRLAALNAFLGMCPSLDDGFFHAVLSACHTINFIGQGLNKSTTLPRTLPRHVVKERISSNKHYLGN